MTNAPPSHTLTIAGIGPGAHEHITPAVLHALEGADVVVGYTTYIKLVRSLIDGKTIIRTGMTEEIGRAQAAVDHALKGKNVIIISSGDGGVYGMLSLVFDVLRQRGWKRDTPPTVKILPGITALNACASLVGAPLGHDFCAVSLSDLLTPWPVIIKRIEAAAQGDFVIGLYNPASGRRTRQIVSACEMIGRYRKPDTPVALVKSAYRRREKIIMTSLEECLEYEIGMLTTVLIGSSQTSVYEGYMLTPRGYQNKYTPIGEVLSGQTPGRSLITDNQEKPYDNQAEPTTLSEALSPQEHHEENAYIVSRLEGSMLLFHKKDGASKGLYMIGERKTPCDFHHYGIEPPKERDPKNVPFIPLTLVSEGEALKVSYPALCVVSSLSLEELARTLARRFLIERNGMVSERLWSFILSCSREKDKIIHANWVLDTPDPLWDMLRDNVLKCL